MVIDTFVVVAVATLVSAALASIKALIELWGDQRMPENAKAKLNDTEKEKIALSQQLIDEVFGGDPVERLRSASNVERINLMDDFANRLSALYGLDIQVDVTVDTLSKCGAYSWSDKKAVFNIAYLMVDGQNELFGNCVWESIDTVVHELRHAVQHRAIVEPGFWEISDERRMAWANNMLEGNYISSATDARGYVRQPVERDAFTFAAEVIEGVKNR